jgi:hypothetical protein
MVFIMEKYYFFLFLFNFIQFFFSNLPLNLYDSHVGLIDPMMNLKKSRTRNIQELKE